MSTLPFASHSLPVAAEPDSVNKVFVIQQPLSVQHPSQTNDHDMHLLRLTRDTSVRPIHVAVTELNSKIIFRLHSTDVACCSRCSYWVYQYPDILYNFCVYVDFN